MLRNKVMSARTQSYVFTIGLLISFLAMNLTDMWLPMVISALVLTALGVESWIRVLYIIPIQKEIKELKRVVYGVEVEIEKELV